MIYDTFVYTTRAHYTHQYAHISQVSTKYQVVDLHCTFCYCAAAFYFLLQSQIMPQRCDIIELLYRLMAKVHLHPVHSRTIPGVWFIYSPNLRLRPGWNRIPPFKLAHSLHWDTGTLYEWSLRTTLHAPVNGCTSVTYGNTQDPPQCLFYQYPKSYNTAFSKTRQIWGIW